MCLMVYGLSRLGYNLRPLKMLGGGEFMPIYEYQCVDCQYEMEVLQKMSDDPLTDCPKCHSSSLTKKVSAAGFRLSGSGWYETDFKSGNKKNVIDSSKGMSGD